jgi:hypothetical protein
MAHGRHNAAARIWWNNKMNTTEQKSEQSYCPTCRTLSDIWSRYYNQFYCRTCKTWFIDADNPHIDDCGYWVGEPCNCVTGGSHDRKLGL